MPDDLVERLRYCAVSDNQCSECKYRGGSPDGSKMCIDLLMEDAADAIEELSKQNEKWEEVVKTALDFIPCWIPVTERLPEEKRDGFSDDVLMLVENPDGDITWKDVYVGYYLYDATSAETGWWAMMTCDCVKIGEHKHGSKVFPANEYVTHWMPLPEPPKEETPTGPYDILYEEGGPDA